MKPTREQILEATDLEEIDVWVAEYVFGEPRPVYIHEPHNLEIKYSGAWWCGLNFFRGDKCHWRPLPFSSEIQYTERMFQRMQYFNLRSLKGGQWHCQSKHCENMGDHIIRQISDDKVYRCGCEYGDGDTAPIAICRAALLAVLEEEE